MYMRHYFACDLNLVTWKDERRYKGKKEKLKKERGKKKEKETPCTIVVSYTIVGWPRIYNNIGMIIHTLTLLIFTLEMYAAPGYVYATLFS